MKYFLFLFLFFEKLIQSLELPRIQALDESGQQYTTLDLNDQFFKKNKMEDYQTCMNEDAIEPIEDMEKYKKEAQIRFGFDSRSLEQIKQTYYDKKIRDFLNQKKDDPYIEGQVIGEDEKTEEDQRIIENLDKSIYHITKIIPIEEDILPSSLFKHKKIVNKVIEDVDDSTQLTKKYVDEYITTINENKENYEKNTKPRLLEYEVKEDKKDFPPFMKAKVTRYWASSSLVGRSVKYRCYKYRYCRYNPSYTCRYLKYCYKYYVYFNFPASNVMKQRSWQSIGDHNAKDIVTFKAALDQTYRLAYIYIGWVKGKHPKELSIHVSNDDKTYTEAIGFQGHSDWVIFPAPIWAKYVKLLMRGLADKADKRFGIYRLDCWTKNYKVMFRSKQKGNSGMCLIVANGDKKEKTPLQMMDCVQAISMVDGRELFQMKVTNQIMHTQSKKCLELKGSPGKGVAIILGDCAPKPSNEFIIDHSDKIRCKGGLTWCVTVVSGGKYDNYAIGAEIETTSESSDNNHPSKLMVDGSEATYWQSADDTPSEQILLKLEANTTVSIISLSWKYPPDTFQILILHSYGIWESVFNHKANSDDKQKIEIAPSLIIGVKIILTKLSEEKGKLGEHLVYGLIDLNLYANTKGIALESCSEHDKSKANQFMIEEYYYNDLKNSTGAVSPDAEKQKLSKEGNMLQRGVAEVLPLPPILSKMLAMARGVKARNSGMADGLDEKDAAITEYRENYGITHLKFIKKYLKGEERVMSGTLATSSDVPASSCAQIREQFPHKVSGFYWVQGECNQNALRVFCDYSIHKGTFYGFLGSLKDGEYLQGVHKIKQVQYKCAQLGLEPVQIEKESQVKTLQRYLGNIGLKLKDSVIAMGYDYDCDISECGGTYKSLKDGNTKDISSVLGGFIDSSNVKNSKFALKGRIDSIGFNYDKGLMSYFALSSKKIKGIICSDNAFDKFGALIDIKCNDTMRNNPKLQAGMHSNVQTMCPKNCGKEKEFKVWGTALYRDDSSICRAAIHAGAYVDSEGGIVYVGVEKGSLIYKGTENNKIKTENYNTYWERSFVINGYIKKCPIDKFKFYQEPGKKKVEQGEDKKQKASSFMQMRMKLKMKSRLKSRLRLLNSLRIYNKQEQEPEQKKEASPEAVKDKDKKDDDDDDKDDDSKKDEKDKKDDDKDEDEKSKDETAKEGGGGKKELKGVGTEEAIVQLQKLNDINLQNIKKFLKMVASAKMLVVEVNKLNTPMAQSDLSGSILSEAIKANALHIVGTTSIFKEMNKDADNRMMETFKFLQHKMFEKMKLQEWLPYKEEYKIMVTIMYDVIDNPKANGPNSKWDTTSSGLKGGHEKAISQTAKRECGATSKCFATLAVLKIFRFYDFTLKASLFMASEGIVGVMFRVEDSANFYVFEMKSMGFKRIRRLYKGESQVVISKNDGGYETEKWYRVMITGRMSTFTVRVEEEEKASSDEGMPVVLEVEDQYLAQGRAGFLTNQMDGFYVDKFEYIPDKCITETQMRMQKNGKIPYELSPDFKKEEVQYNPPQCSRFHENYKMKLELLWKQLIHDSLSRGPPIWKYKKKFRKRESALVIDSKVYSALADQPGAILYLDYHRSCRDGVINIQFVAEDDGYVALIFRMKNKQNFYIVEMHGEVKKQCKLKKVIDGKYRLLASQDEVGYEKTYWHQLQVHMSGDTFRFYFEKINGTFTQLFGDIKDDEMHADGSIALSSFLTRAAFDEVRMYPISDIPKPKEDIMGEEPLIQPLEDESAKEKDPLSKVEEKKGGKEEGKKKKKKKNKDGKEMTKAEIKREKIEETKITWDVCLKNRDQKSRFQYCKEQFGFDDKAYTFCADDYCGSCCDQVIDNLHKVQRFTCRKECKESTIASKEGKPYQTCLESPAPQKGAEAYCKQAFQKIPDQINCSQGFCDMCCITIITANILVLDDKTVNQCHADCMMKFNAAGEVVMPAEDISGNVMKYLQTVIIDYHDAHKQE